MKNVFSRTHCKGISFCVRTQQLRIFFILHSDLIDLHQYKAEKNYAKKPSFISFGPFSYVKKKNKRRHLC